MFIRRKNVDYVLEVLKVNINIQVDRELIEGGENKSETAQSMVFLHNCLDGADPQKT